MLITKYPPEVCHVLELRSKKDWENFWNQIGNILFDIVRRALSFYKNNLSCNTSFLKVEVKGLVSVGSGLSQSEDGCNDAAVHFDAGEDENLQSRRW